jgi:ABC-type branched-subunit amino acid transport system substrate-binding protein/serine/threonine protein kinase
MEVYCTRPLQPNEAPHKNSIPDDLIQSRLDDEAVNQQLKDCRCQVCQMPLVLDNARYIPTQEIGQGGFGRAFLAIDRKFNAHKRVLKQLRHNWFAFEWQLEWAQDKFQEEARILDKLKHKHIPRIYMPFTVLADPDRRFQAESQRFFYLAQEYVDGRDLQQFLKQSEQPFSEAEVTTLLKNLLVVLDYIHSEGIIHRDVKPSNIIQRTQDKSYHLIDFGAVKVLQLAQESAQNEVGTCLKSTGFSAPEVEDGQAYVQSDLYSLAATCVNLLTRRNPKTLGVPKQLDSWHKSAKVSPKFVAILNRMLQEDYLKRYKTAAEVLQALTPPRFSTWQKVMFAAIGLGSLGLLGWLGWRVTHTLNEPIPTSQLPQYLSRGEDILVDDGRNAPANSVCQQAFESKKKGVEAFARADYSTALTSFEQAIEQFKQARQIGDVPAIDQNASSDAKKATCATDPETVVFRNNAKAILKGNPLTIAVSLPIGDPAWRGVAIEMLTGVAQVQQEFNEAAHDRLLQVILTRDDNDKAISTQVAQAVLGSATANNPLLGAPADASNTEVLGVIGHLTSVATQAAGEVYQSQKLVLISPSSTAVRSQYRASQYRASQYRASQYRASPQFSLSNIVFRTATTDVTAGQDLATYAKSKGYKMALVVHNHDDFYSQSLKQVFTDTLGQQDESLECDLVTKTAQDCLRQAAAKGADMLLLAIGTTYIDKTKDIINTNQRHLPILAGDAQYSGELLGSVGQAAEGMVVAVAWHRDLADERFKQKLIDQWGTRSISWRVGTAYDATIALVEAIQRSGAVPTRQAVYDALKQPDFSAVGATGTVRFEASGDRQVFTGLGVLVQVKQQGGLRTFTRLETPKR